MLLRPQQAVCMPETHGWFIERVSVPIKALVPESLECLIVWKSWKMNLMGRWAEEILFWICSLYSWAGHMRECLRLTGALFERSLLSLIPSPMPCSLFLRMHLAWIHPPPPPHLPPPTLPAFSGSHIKSRYNIKYNLFLYTKWASGCCYLQLLNNTFGRVHVQ